MTRPRALLGSLALSAAVGCASPVPGDPDRVDAFVRTRLVLLDLEPKVGGSLRIRIELVNDGPWTVLYDRQQADCNGSLEVIGPDGRPVPYLGGPASTGGASERLGPRSSVVVVEELDVASDYLVACSGQYRLRFHGRNMSVFESHAPPAAEPDPDAELDPDKEPPGRSLLPTSAVQAVHVAAGAPNDRLMIAERLSAAVPEPWELEWGRKAVEPRFVFRRWTGNKSNWPWISVRISSGTPGPGEKREGQWSGRHVYLAAHREAEALWPGFRARIVAALDGR